MSLSAGDWITTPPQWIDDRGPVARPFKPFPDPAIAPSMLELFGATTARQATRVAAEDADGPIDFAALLSWVRGLGAAIAAGPPGAVGVLLPPSIAYVAAVFGCLAAGRVCVLLDRSYPAARNAAIAAQTGIATLVTRPGDDPFPGTRALPAASFQTGTAAAMPTPGNLDDPAFILCTSGSTGRPKAIVHSQRTMLSWCHSHHNAMHVTPEDRILSLASPSALSGFVGLLNCTVSGAAQHILDIRTAGFRGVVTALSTRPVSMVRGTPSMLRALAALPAFRDAATGLRVVQVSGEPFMRSDLDLLRTVLPEACLIRSTYGSTEASGLAWFARTDDAHDPLRVASGRLLSGTAAAIVDERGQACPRGQPGELVVASRYNALGEWLDGELVPLEPDPADPQRRIFRTGDLARCDPDGVFVVLGRQDRMLKVNGQRLEPAEVEAALRRSPEVAHAEIVLRQRGRAVSLAAFVVPRPGNRDGLAERLQAALRDALPAYMVPSRIVLLPAIPVLPGGKTDMAALLRLADAQPA